MIQRFIIWICSKFTREQIFEIIERLLFICFDRDPTIKPKDDFKEKHPNYRNFYVHPLPPTKAPAPQKEDKLNYKEIIAEKEKESGKKFEPVKHKPNSFPVPENLVCPKCSAPKEYLYFNDGKKRTQMRCKVCSNFFPLEKKKRLITKYFCPCCGKALYKWKEKKEYTAYKCDNDTCPEYLKNKETLNPREKLLQKSKSSQFKLRYQYREYHFHLPQLTHSSPEKPKVDLKRIHKSSNILGLILALYISFAIPARKTALMLRKIFNIDISYQTVLNYAEAASFYCHSFNLKYKGDIDNENSADECYIKVSGKYAYTFFVISAKSRKIISYHIDSSRDTLPATIALYEAIRTAKEEQKISFITDGNPSYTAAVHFLNQSLQPLNQFQKYSVIGLQNLDEESELYRHFKQLSERLNRTYKYHIRNANGFKNQNGAKSLTTLFVTHYNFIRPHYSLKYKPPVELPELQNIQLYQDKWLKILELALPS